jgi:uncharacterized DUF497 family protein
MNFEFDPPKSASNKLKHGIDFEEAQDLWSIPGLVLSSDRLGELRFVRIAPTSERIFWTFAYTMRDQSIRIISVRRSRKEEPEAYEREIERG